MNIPPPHTFPPEFRCGTKAIWLAKCPQLHTVLKVPSWSPFDLIFAPLESWESGLSNGAKISRNGAHGSDLWRVWIEVRHRKNAANSRQLTNVSYSYPTYPVVCRIGYQKQKVGHKMKALAFLSGQGLEKFNDFDICLALLSFIDNFSRDLLRWKAKKIMH